MASYYWCLAVFVACSACSNTCLILLETELTLIMDNHIEPLSPYAEELPPEAKKRYIQKITTIDNVDPFVSGRIGEITEEVPPVDACDLVSYLVLQTSFVTSSQFKARKGLEAYNQFVSGWIIYFFYLFYITV